jgi:hypothetical protein
LPLPRPTRHCVVAEKSSVRWIFGSAMMTIDMSSTIVV